MIERDAREFLDHLLDMNSTRVQSDVVARVLESRSQLEVEIRKLLHEVSRIAENALEHAPAAGAEGAYPLRVDYQPRWKNGLPYQCSQRVRLRVSPLSVSFLVTHDAKSDEILG